MSYLNKVQEWLKTNTFSIEDFNDLQELEIIKNKKQLKVSVVIPTLEEEGTIYDLINHIIEKLVLNYKLVDEIVVIDGGSNDSTVKKLSN